MKRKEEKKMVTMVTKMTGIITTMTALCWWRCIVGAELISEAGRKVITKTAVTTNSMAAVLRLAIRYRSCSVSLALATTDRRCSSMF